MSDTADTEAAEKKAKRAKNKPDPKLAKHVARVIAGTDKKAWTTLGKEGQKPHILKAKRVLTAISRYSSKPRDAKATADDDMDDD